MVSAVEKQLPNIQSGGPSQTSLRMRWSRPSYSGAELVRSNCLICESYVNLFLLFLQPVRSPFRFKLPAPQPPAPCRSDSERTTKGKALLPLHPLDIKIGVDQSRGTKRSAAVVAHVDEAPDEDQGGDSKTGPRKVVTPVGRRTTRVRFQSPPESLPKQRRRVGDDLETAEAAPDELCGRISKWPN